VARPATALIAHQQGLPRWSAGDACCRPPRTHPRDPVHILDAVENPILRQP
jgi:hypothetical protein